MTILTTLLLLIVWVIALYPVAVALKTRNSFKVWDALMHSVVAASLLVFFGMLIAITWGARG